jgi:hypothetical protein
MQGMPPEEMFSASAAGPSRNLEIDALIKAILGGGASARPSPWGVQSAGNAGALLSEGGMQGAMAGGPPDPLGQEIQMSQMQQGVAPGASEPAAYGPPPGQVFDPIGQEIRMNQMQQGVLPGAPEPESYGPLGSPSPPSSTFPGIKCFTNFGSGDVQSPDGPTVTS